MARSLFAVLAVLGCIAASPAQQRPDARAVVQRHADHCERLHRELEGRATALQKAVQALVERPAPATLQAARTAWAEARLVYGQVEVLRFHGGPIDAVEPLLNAWPVDEVYIDYVVGRRERGLVSDRTRLPVLAGAALEHRNGLGGETNISVGWHAIEFLLWGQDLDAAGPGRRPHTDFVDGADPDAARRRQYLAVVTDLLVGHVRDLTRQWAPGADNFRRRYEANPDDAIRRMLTGAVILTAFELSGERLAVPFETRDQEQEHSCFSDTTCADLVANQIGIEAIFRGGLGEPSHHDLLLLVRSRDAELADHLAACLDAATRALRAIPAPFDQAFLGADDAPGRKAIAAAIAALDQQGEAIALTGRLFGFELPLQPGR
ncbi:MAG: iron-regulated protein [Planctomycetes bacterium]|nr:iron-regulated protein [Planctomycetota bacterium]